MILESDDGMSASPDLQGWQITMSAVNRPMHRADWAMLFALSGLWGGSFFFVAIAVDELPPITTASLRIGLAALAMNLLLRAIKVNIPAVPALWRDFLIMGSLNLAIPFALIAWGQTRIDSGLASIFNATTPFSTAIVAHFLTRDERMTRSRLVGVTVASADHRHRCAGRPGLRLLR